MKGSTSLQPARNYGKHLPLITKVVQGFCGIDDDDEYAYSADEIYRLERVKIQNKMIFKNGHGKFFSVPENYHCRFQILYDKGQKSPPMYMLQLLDRLDIGMKVALEEDDKRTYKLPVLGESEIVSENLGILQYEDFYEEKVLVGRPLIDAIPQPEQVEIPSFVDIQLVLANGLEGGTQYDYDKICADIIESCKGFRSLSVQTYREEIMLVTCDIDELTEEYNNVTPVHYVRCDQITRSREVQERVEQINQNMVSSEAYITVKPPVTERADKKKASHPASELFGVLYGGGGRDEEDYELPSTLTRSLEVQETVEQISQTMVSSKANITVKPPVTERRGKYKASHSAPERSGAQYRKGRRDEEDYEMPCTMMSGGLVTPPLPPPHSKVRVNRGTLRLPAPPPGSDTELPRQRSLLPCTPTPGPPPVAVFDNVKLHDYVNKVNQVAPLQRDQDIYNCIEGNVDECDDYIEMQAVIKPAPMLQTSSPTTTTTPLCRSGSSSSAYCQENSYGSFADVPDRVSNMSVGEVAGSMRLMKLDKHIDRFIEECIDGSMLQDLDEDILLNDFNFTAFECRKLTKFISGWRPKQQTD